MTTDGSPWTIRLESLALALLSGILLAVPFLLPALWWLHYVALVPWVVLVIRPEVRASWLYFFVGMYTFFIMATGPFSLFHKALPFFMGAVYAPFMIPFALLVRYPYLRYRVPLTALVPIAWVATEWFRLQFSVGQAGFYPLGTAQFTRLTLIQIADLTGIYGVSFLVAAANGAIADLVVNRNRWGWKTLWPAALYPLALLLVLGYGVWRNADRNFLPGPRLALIQPNVTHYKDPVTVMATVDEHLQFTRAEIAPGTADMIVWPENAVSLPFGDDPAYLEKVATLAAEQGADVVLGAVTRASTQPPRIYTSAYHVSATGQVVDRYDKLHLIPWAEYMPFERLMASLGPGATRAHYRLAKTLLGYNSFGMPGDDLVLFSIGSGADGYRFAVPICFEVSSGGFARDVAARGGSFLLNITSEGFFGPPVYTHMLAHSIFRAIENRIAVVRVGNHGISGFIAPNGQARLVRGNESGRPYLEAGTLIDRVPINPAPGGTFYTRVGDLVAYLSVLISLGLLGAAAVSRRRASASSAAGT